MTISALIVARNEEKRIEECLSSLTFVDEIVVILDRSTDKTLKICKRFSNKIFSGKWTCEGKRRNFGIEKCSSEWIFEVDADEIITNSLALEVKKKIKLNKYDYFYIPLTNHIYSTPVKYGWMACLAPDGKFCLFKKKNKFWHEGLVHPSYSIKGEKGPFLENYINHFMSKDISELLVRFNRNSSLHALELKNKNLKKYFSFRKVFSRFLKSYFLRKGYKEGKLGFLICILNALYPMVSAIKSREDLT
jgi:glycosyltransferase involved in cell wall biosynthesis